MLERKGLESDLSTVLILRIDVFLDWLNQFMDIQIEISMFNYRSLLSVTGLLTFNLFPW